MKTYDYAIAGDPVKVHVPENHTDMLHFLAWFEDADRRGPIALDTETTGLDIYAPGYRLRTVQFGDRHTGWVIPWELGEDFVGYASRALRLGRRFQIHNAPFDWAVLDRHAGASIESLAPRTIDTRLKAGLVDPRQPQEGGRGTALKPLAAWYLDPNAPDTQGDLTAVFRSLKLTKATGWAGIPIDHPTYLLYAGLDVILTARLDTALDAELDMLGVRPRLIAYEHEIARICAVMQRTGMVLDTDYTRELDEQLGSDALMYEASALRYGVTNVNAAAQLREAFVAMGEVWSDVTPGGMRKVDKAVLHRFADLDFQSGKPLGTRKPNPLAEAIIRSKRAGKWRSAYTQTFLETADSGGRIHPFINSMQARTGRMSITRPALQTLPSGDAMIRRCLLAEPGHVMVSTDFAAVELRVLAALADVQRMKQAIGVGEDLHSFTARLVFGDDFTPKHRKISKGIAFGKVYGGGAATISRQTGAPEDDVRRALAAYDRAYPEIARYSRALQREAYAHGMVGISVTGRRLPVDRERVYAVTNYAVQSAARDVLGQSLINLEEAGLLPYMRLPIHDEVLCSVPQAEAAHYAREVERCMTFDLMGVPIEAEAEIGKRSWGSLYGAAE
ncbi:DNA polymerase [Streptomyces europaeiscabiei]|uniref:DNA polymerase I n=1 Tax=Streptomyces europaeiscabiei TaxID=146819 RepID=A0ABU4N641_9ACTN|nr:DNA polymerase [Streptomyces europaeiscabiei]MDX3551016.1 DNA polymerase [Streptomyces europaeiscabiei]MDX3698424.1 DNA polymerase [Streptomyces europaeiscabiei]